MAWGLEVGPWLGGSGGGAVRITPQGPQGERGGRGRQSMGPRELPRDWPAGPLRSLVQPPPSSLGSLPQVPLGAQMGPGATGRAKAGEEVALLGKDGGGTQACPLGSWNMYFCNMPLLVNHFPDSSPEPRKAAS